MKGLEILNNLNNLIEEALIATSEENLGGDENVIFTKHLAKIKQLNAQAEAELKAWNTDRYIYLLQVIGDTEFIEYDRAVILAEDGTAAVKFAEPHFQGISYSLNQFGTADKGVQSGVVVLCPNVAYKDH